jgi:hypothetical protein
MDSVFVVFRNSDETEGRGYSILDCIFTNEVEASIFCRDAPGIQGVRGANSGVYYKERPLFKSANDRIDYDKNKIKRDALAKLTALEKEALGLL